MKKIFIGFVFISVYLSVHSQKLSINQYRMINYNVLGLLEDYNNYASFSRKNHKQRFLNLFERDSALIYNDYLPDYNGAVVSPQTYCALLERANYKHYYTIYDVSFDKIDSVSSSVYVVSLTFEKRIRFRAKSGNKNYPEVQFKMSAKVKCNLNDSTYKFTELKCKYPVSNKFQVLSAQNINNKRWRNLLSGLPDIGADSVCLINDYSELNSVRPSSPGVLLKIVKDVEDNRYNYLKIKELKYSVGFHYNNFIGNLYETSISSQLNSRFSNVSNISNGFEAGVDFMFKLFGRARTRGLFEFGLSLSGTNLKSKADYADSYFSVDPDGDKYQRFTDLSMSEENHFTNIVLPVLYRYEIFLSQRFLLYGGIGVKNYFCVNQNYKASGGSFYRGYYADLYNVTIDQNGIYDFGHFNEIIPEQKQTLEFYSIDYYLTGGISYTYKNRFAFDCALFHQSGLSKLSTTNSGYQMSVTHGNYSSLIGAMTGLKRRILGLEIKVRYNF